MVAGPNPKSQLAGTSLYLFSRPSVAYDGEAFPFSEMASHALEKALFERVLSRS